MPDNIKEENGRCILSVTPENMRAEASLQTFLFGFLSLFVITIMAGAMHDPSKRVVALLICPLILIIPGVFVLSNWKEVKNPPSPIILTRKGITVPQQREEILWDDIHAIYFKRNTFGRNLTVHMYIDPKKSRRFAVDGWSLYASRDQWKHLLRKYSQRDIIINP